MKEREIEARLHRALDHVAPDDLESVLSRCGPQNEKVVPMSQVAGRRRKGRGTPWLGVAACLALILVGGGVGWQIYGANMVASMVSLDVNPSVRLDVNSKQRVLAAVAINEDADEILDGMDLVGTDLDVAVNALVGSLLKHGYVDELANSILISVEDDDTARGTALEQKLTAEIELVLNSAQVNGAILSQTLSGDAVLQQKADEYGISLGKASLIQSLVDGSNHLQFEALVGLSINELNLLAGSEATRTEETATSQQTDGIHSVGTASQNAYIGAQAAQQIALQHAGVSAGETLYLKSDYDYEDGCMVYEVEFATTYAEYEYDIEAVTGTIYKHEQEMLREEPPSQTPAPQQTAAPSRMIGAGDAQRIAFQHAGIAETDAYEVQVEGDLEDEAPSYKVEFKAGGTEYEYEIDAVSGMVLEFEKDEE